MKSTLKAMLMAGGVGITQGIVAIGVSAGGFPRDGLIKAGGRKFRTGLGRPSHFWPHVLRFVPLRLSPRREEPRCHEADVMTPPNAPARAALSVPSEPSAMTNVYDLNAARRAAGLNVSRGAMSDGLLDDVRPGLPACCTAWGSWEIFRQMGSPALGGARDDIHVMAYEITTRCAHGFRVAIRVLADDALALDIGCRDVIRRMRRKHGVR